MNKNFSEFIAEVRVGHTCKLLMDSDRSISEICYLSGYNNLTHFNQKFKQLMGKTPKVIGKVIHERWYFDYYNYRG